jgi:peptidoglycan hydrolase CwlO-like protein
MDYQILVGALELIGLLIVVIVPVIRLNSNITALTASVESLKDIIAELKDRITTHGQEIDELRTEVVSHEERIKWLEKEADK